MTVSRPIFPVVAIVAGLSGCVNIPQPRGDKSDDMAGRILKQCADATGSSSLDRLNDIDVSYEGHWDWLVSRVQPVLVDAQFRGCSTEHYLIHEPTVTQTHAGPGGTKRVYHDLATTRVWYNDQENVDPEVRDAAALVADNYRMFLLGPRFFQERQATVQYLGAGPVEGRECDHILAIMRPGIGRSVQDRAIVSIDRREHLIRRLRITVEGLESTRGAIADIYLQDPIRVDGIVWPTHFYEELEQPFRAPVHHWRLTAIHYGRQD